MSYSRIPVGATATYAPAKTPSSANNSDKAPERDSYSLPGPDSIIIEYVNGDVGTKNYSEEVVLQLYGLFGKKLVNTACLRYVATGQQEQANDMLQKSTPEGLLPFLLKEPGRVTDYTETLDRSVQRTSYVTIYQFALMAMHVRYHPDEICMREMIMRHFTRLPNYQVELDKQFDEQFPPGWQDAERKRAVEDSLALNKVVQAIIAAPKDATYEVLEKACEADTHIFRKHLDDQLIEVNVVDGQTQTSARVFKKGFHFNAWPLDEKAKDEEKVYGLLGEALQLYANNFATFGGRWDSPKNRLFAKIIDEHILNFVPAKLAQVICMSFYRYMQEKQKLSQSFEFHYAPGYCIFRCLASSTLKYDMEAAVGGWRGAWGPGSVGGFFQNLCQTTTASLQNHAARPTT